MKRLLKNIRDKEKGILIGCIGYGVMSSIAPIFMTMLPKFIIDEVLSETPSLIGVVGISAVILIIGGIALIIKHLIMRQQFPKLLKLRLDYRREFSTKLMEMNYENTEDAAFYANNARAFSVTGTNEQGIEGVYKTAWELPALCLTALIYAVILSRENLLLLSAVLVKIIATGINGKKMMKYRFCKKEDLGKEERKLNYFANVGLDFSYGKDIRLYRLQKHIIINFYKHLKKIVNIQKKISAHDFFLHFIETIIYIVSNTIIYGTLAFSVTKGMNVGDFSMYLAMALGMSAILEQMCEKILFIKEESFYIEEFFEFLDEKIDKKREDRIERELSDGPSVEFRNVYFKYPNMEEWILKGLNLKISAKQHLAIVGVNGSGKTTIVKLMTGLYKTDIGQILINNRDIKEYTKEELVQLFSVVFQDVNVYAYTVAENVSCQTQEINYELVDESLRKVGLRRKVEKLPKGNKQMMLKIIEGDGVEFSGGENQKLSIARALYKDAGLVILDEPSSALDALAEKELYQDINGLVKNKIAIFISHRMSSTKFCNAIAVLDNGSILEYGTHEELMNQKGRYFTMFQVQGKYYRNKEEWE